MPCEECVSAPWSVERVHDFVFLMIKPLYGLQDSPLRWFLSLSACLRRNGYHQRITDICTLAFFVNGIPDTWILAYVDDLLISYRDDVAKNRFMTAISTFNIGDPESVLARKYNS